MYDGLFEVVLQRLGCEVGGGWVYVTKIDYISINHRVWVDPWPIQSHQPRWKVHASVQGNQSKEFSNIGVFDGESMSNTLELAIVNGCEQ